MRAKVAPLTFDIFLRYGLLYLLVASYVALLYAMLIVLLLALRLVLPLLLWTRSPPRTSATWSCWPTC